MKEKFSLQEAEEISKKLEMDFNNEKFDLNQFWMGVNVELEHGTRDPKTDVTGDEPLMTGKIALAHLNEFPDYYDRLEKLEKEAEEFWDK
ncbi:MAG: DUF5661 family protein [bacterium]